MKGGTTLGDGCQATRRDGKKLPTIGQVNATSLFCEVCFVKSKSAQPVFVSTLHLHAELKLTSYAGTFFGAVVLAVFSLLWSMPQPHHFNSDGDNATA